MADHHRHFRVHQALRHRRARAWVGDIVLGDQFELGHLVTDFQLLLVGLFYGNLNAMLDVLSLVRRRAGQGAGEADPDNFTVCCVCRPHGHQQCYRGREAVRPPLLLFMLSSQ